MGTPQTTDAKSPVATCSQRQQKVQLLPIRYAIVEQDLFKRPHVQTSAEAITDLAILTNTASTSPLKNNEAKPYPISLPHQLTYDLKSRPVGLRLVRDGYLYIYEKTGIFYEYKLKNGLPEQLLWAHTKLPDADTRTVDQKQDLKLLFNRTSTIYVCYSEIQWTMAKCKQIMGSPTECDDKMQKVNLSAVDCQQGGVHLLTQAQYEAFQSELNDDRLIATSTLNQLKTDKSITDQSPLLKSYVWEENHNPDVGTGNALRLQGLIDPQYKDDHLYLVIRDDIGMLRDLAEYQDKIINLRKAWHNDEDIQYKFGIGCYVKSLYNIDERILNNVAKTSPKFQEFENDLNQTQKQSVIDYIKARAEGTYATEDKWYYYIPFVDRSEGFGDWENNVATAKEKMKASLGNTLYKKYEDYIEAMDINTINALNGANFGSQGIQDRVNRPAMEKYLAEQERYFAYLNSLIKKINQDRMTLFKAKAFLTSAWHYCAQSKEQTEQHAALHYNAYKDLGLGEEQLQTIAEQISSDPKALHPMLYTLPAKERDDTGDKINNIINNAKEIFTADSDFQTSQKLSSDLRTLLEQAAPHTLDLTGTFGAIDATINGTIYDPAIQKEMASKIIALHDQLADNPLKLRAIIRDNIPRSQLNRLLTRLAGSGLTIEVSSLEQMQAFFDDVEKTQQLRAERRTHKAQRLKYERAAAQKGLNQLERQNFQNAAIKEQAAFKQKGIELANTEKSIASALSPLPPEKAEAGRIGFTLKGLDPAQISELRAMANDYHLGQVSGAASKLKTIYAGLSSNALSVAIVCYQLKGFCSALSKLRGKGAEASFPDYIEFLDTTTGFLSATFGLAQSLAATTLELKLAQYSSTAGKLTTALKFGALLEPFSVFGYFFGMVASAFTFSKQANLIANAKDNTDPLAVLSGLLSLSASGGLTALNAYGTVRSASVIINAYKLYRLSGLARGLLAVGAESIAFIARFTLIGLGLTLIEWLGSWLFNRYNVSKLDTWLTQCIWSKDPSKRCYHTLWVENRALNEILNAPIARIQNINLKSINKHFKRLSFTFPSITAESLNESQLTISASVLYDLLNHDEIENYTESFKSQLQLISNPNEPLVVAFDILPEMYHSFDMPCYAITIGYPTTPEPNVTIKPVTYFVQSLTTNPFDSVIDPFDFNIVWHKAAQETTLTLADIITDTSATDSKG